MRSSRTTRKRALTGANATYGGENQRRTISVARSEARTRIDQQVERLKAAAFARLEQAEDLDQIDRIVDALVDGSDTLPFPADTGNALADRIGPVWTLKGAAARMVGQGTKPLTAERLRQRVTDRTLVGLFTRDRKWVLPAWQFRVVDGQLRVRDDVVALWQLLPHDPQRTSAWTTAAWMVSPLGSLESDTPLGWLDRRGLDQTLVAAAARVRARTAA